MVAVLKGLVLIPVALVAVVLAVANRAPVLLSLDPFTRDVNHALAVSLPLYLVIMGAVAVGVILGGTAVWLKQRAWRRRARQAEAELATARAETQRLRAELQKSAPPVVSSTGLPVVFDRTAA